MAKYVIAVSGGVDSVVLLDALCRQRKVARERLPEGEVVVAHFDHGIRDNSDEDVQFVRQLAKNYRVPFVTRREELGADASEELARDRRYAFLFAVCAEYGGQLVTAHHADDVVETAAINIVRGTGWRGLAALDNNRIMRPLLRVTKQDILEYAKAHALQWREDSTNASDAYLRNRLRRALDAADDDIKWQVLALHARQVELKKAIDKETSKLAPSNSYSRYFFGHCGDAAAMELLRQVFIAQVGVSPATKPRQRALHAIKVAKPGRIVHVADNISLRFTQREFIVERIRSTE